MVMMMIMRKPNILNDHNVTYKLYHYIISFDSYKIPVE